MKRILTALSVGVFISVLCVVGAVAQQTPARVINGGVVNGKALSLPKPLYPETARVAGISGAIAVNVVIDEAGTVISAEADPFDQRERHDADGNKLDPVEADLSLREAAQNAALQARFAPTMLSGQPVKVKGRIVFSFLADKTGMVPSDADTPGGKSIAVVYPDGTAIVQKQMPNGGVLNGRAKELPAPAYPAAARAVQAEGAVTVQVIVDEGGNVVDAAAVSGHPLLRAAAEKAAREAKFEPTYLNGAPLRFSGVLTYNFVLPKKEHQP